MNAQKRRARATEKIARLKAKAFWKRFSFTFIQGSYEGTELCPVLVPEHLTISGTVEITYLDESFFEWPAREAST